MNRYLPELFTLPFIIGTVYFLILVITRFVRWFLGLSKIDKIRVWKGLRTRKTWQSVKDSVREGLLHRSIFKVNPRLGYMHMSLAFGWFLLIVIGHIETMWVEGSVHFPIYNSIFHRYFYTEHPSSFTGQFFATLMDFILLFVLSGVFLAFLKRFSSSVFGMQRSTKLKSGDRIALISLWFIFPLRFLAESITAGYYHNGGVVSQSAGKLLASGFDLEKIIYPSWTAYSLAIGFFLIALPNSRYMHIPAEIFYIFLRNYGVKLKRRINSYTNVQVFSCSRCGICLDACQMNVAGIRTQSVYMLKNIRNHNLTDDVLFNCLLCGRCQQTCPVGIELNDLRITQRIESTRQYNSSYDYLREGKIEKSKVIYFAGCMTHLTPGIKELMKKIFDVAGIQYWFMDEEKAPCCGRPLMQAGQFDAAEKLIHNNRQKILGSGADTLVVSCPICYKVFYEDYALPNIKVVHHSEFILDLIEKGKIEAANENKRMIYHDPCELGRGSNIYDQPREVLRRYGRLVPIAEEKENSLCCGGSLSNINIPMEKRDVIMNYALDSYKEYDPDMLVTSCPLCKKTFARGNKLEVKDIAEVVAENLSDVSRHNDKKSVHSSKAQLV